MSRSVTARIKALNDALRRRVTDLLADRDALTERLANVVTFDDLEEAKAKIETAMDDSIRKITTERDTLKARCEALEEIADCARWFCDRVERGEIRSARTYERFKKALDNFLTGEGERVVAEGAGDPK